MILTASGIVEFDFEALAVKDSEGTVTYASGSASVDFDVNWDEEDQDYVVKWAISDVNDLVTYDEDEEIVIEEFDEEDEDHEEIKKLIIEALKLYRADEIEDEVRQWL